MNTIYLGLDFGDRRVGVAASDTDKRIAFPRDFLEYSSVSALLAKLQQICEEDSVEKIILGLPLLMDGTTGPRAAITHQFGEKLQKALPHIPIVFVDERLSSQYATAALRSQGLKAKHHKGKRDALSAQIILQNYLNREAGK